MFRECEKNEELISEESRLDFVTLEMMAIFITLETQHYNENKVTEHNVSLFSFPYLIVERNVIEPRPPSSHHPKTFSSYVQKVIV